MRIGNIPNMTGERMYSYTYAPVIYNADKRPGIRCIQIHFKSVIMIIQKYTWQFCLHDALLHKIVFKVFQNVLLYLGITISVFEIHTN